MLHAVVDFQRLLLSSPLPVKRYCCTQLCQLLGIPIRCVLLAPVPCISTNGSCSRLYSRPLTTRPAGVVVRCSPDKIVQLLTDLTGGLHSIRDAFLLFRVRPTHLFTLFAAIQVTTTHMATRQARRAANKEGNMYSVKTGFKSIFTHPQLAATTLQAVQYVSPILIESNILANLHVLRCLETDGNVPKIDQTFFSNCMYAVTNSTGHRAVQFDRAKNMKLTESLDIYVQQLPSDHLSPERPTYIKDVSPARVGPIAALAVAKPA